MKRLIAAASLVATGFFGAGFIGGTVAYADDNGVGPSGTTGRARACEVHAENNGNSYAKGLECAPTLVVTVLGPSSEDSPNCSIRVVGTGLEPGSVVIARLLGRPTIAFEVGTVGPAGTLNTVVDVFNQPNTLVVSATTASGEVIQTSFLPIC